MRGQRVINKMVASITWI